MDRIPVTNDLSTILPTRYSPLAITDDQGNILGHYVPKLTLDDVALEGGWPSVEELEAIAKHPGKRYTTQEVIAHLRSLG